MADDNEPMECVCGWKGRREQCPMNPRQGWLCCPRCWHEGYDRIPGSPELMAKQRREREAYYQTQGAIDDCEA